MDLFTIAAAYAVFCFFVCCVANVAFTCLARRAQLARRVAELMEED